MSRQGIVVAIVVGSLVAALAVLVWRENERRYAALAITGCFGDSAQSPLGVSQECTGAAPAGLAALLRLALGRTAYSRVSLV